MTSLQHRPVLRRLFRVPVVLYHWHCGWLLGRRFLLLVHAGRRTGTRHETVLEIVEYRPRTCEAIVLSGFGRSAGWLRNIQAHPTPTVTIGSQQFAAICRELDADEAIAVLARYEARNRLVRPIVRRVLSRLLGWSYDGSDIARRRVVAQLPFIAFRPRPDESA